MPKPINTKSPIGAIRQAYGFSIDQLSELVGHGAAMLRQVEAGLKPLPDALADKIFEATGVPHELLQKRSLTKKDRDTIARCRLTVASGASRFSITEAAAIIPETLAMFYALQEAGVNPRVWANTLRRERAKILHRFGIDPVRYEAAYISIRGSLHSWTDERAPVIGEVERALSLSETVQNCEKIMKDRLEKEAVTREPKRDAAARELYLRRKAELEKITQGTTNNPTSPDQATIYRLREYNLEQATEKLDKSNMDLAIEASSRAKKLFNSRIENIAKKRATEKRQ